MASTSSSDARSTLIIYALLHSEALTQVLSQHLQEEPSSAERHQHFVLNKFKQPAVLVRSLRTASPQPDCLIFEEDADLLDFLSYLHSLSILIPTVIISAGTPVNPQPDDSTLDASALVALEMRQLEERPLQADVEHLYHAATLSISTAQLDRIAETIDEAIARFLQLSLEDQLVEPKPDEDAVASLTVRSSLVKQQKRLAEKLKERLGYLGVYYKRNPAHFLRHMSHSEKQELLDQLKINYRQIILSYFSSETGLNQEIDSFVNLAFFADVPVAQIVEIHMELMDEFAKQLKLEGRSDEVLLDYRLTLIDTIAHLCEMYRRSIPRES
jgi:circadian clock protein KaiA